MVTYFQIALIITSIALIAAIVLQNKGIGLGGLSGQDTGGVFGTRRGIEKILFNITVVLSVLFIILVMATIAVNS